MKVVLERGPLHALDTDPQSADGRYPNTHSQSVDGLIHATRFGTYIEDGRPWVTGDLAIIPLFFFSLSLVAALTDFGLGALLCSVNQVCVLLVGPVCIFRRRPATDQDVDELMMSEPLRQWKWR
jgi:hypothetical protein